MTAKFSYKEREKAEEYFNDVPWWFTEVSSEEDSVGGLGVPHWVDTTPKLFFVSFLSVFFPALAYFLLGIWAVVAVVVVGILWKLYTHRKRPKYEVKRVYEHNILRRTHNYSVYTNYSRKNHTGIVATMKTVGLFKTTVLVKKYVVLSLSNHVNSFDRLAEAGEGN